MFVRDVATKNLINNDDSYYRSVLALRESQKREKKRQTELDLITDQYLQLRKIVNEIIEQKTNNG